MADYDITLLGPVGSTNMSRAFAINNAGTPVGVVHWSTGMAFVQDGHPAIWSPGEFLLPTEASLVNFAGRVNSSGSVVGQALYSGGLMNAAYYWDGSLHLLSDLFGWDGWTKAVDINDAGTILIEHEHHAYLYDTTAGGSPLDIGYLSSVQGPPLALNNKGQVVWSNPLPPGPGSSLLLYDNGEWTDKGSLGSDGYVWAINDNGKACGRRSSPVTGEFVAYVCHTDSGPAAFEDLGVPSGSGFTESCALDINIHGDVVGYCTGGIVPSDEARAFVRAVAGPNANEILDLNDLIPAGSGWVLKLARGINDKGQIVGEGHYFGTLKAFLLDPTWNKRERPHGSYKLNLDWVAIDPVAKILGDVLPPERVGPPLPPGGPFLPVDEAVRLLRTMRPEQQRRALEHLRALGAYAQAVEKGLQKSGPQ